MRPPLGVGVNDGAGQAAVYLRVGFRGVYLLQRHVPVRPGQVEDPVGQVAVAVLFYQRAGGFLRVADPGDIIYDRRFAGLEPDAAAD